MYFCANLDGAMRGANDDDGFRRRRYAALRI
jgi:hypothetical protein